MLLVHKLEIDPNRAQATYFAKACGVARFAFNWALQEWQQQYKAGRKPTEASLRKLLNGLKHESYPWMQEVTKVAPQQAIKNLGDAFKRFFRHQGRYPRFKKKGIRDAFRADNGPAKKGEHAAIVAGNKLKLPRVGWVKMKEALRFQGQIMSVTVSRRAGRWFAAISVECEGYPHERKNQGSVGVDLGIHTLATLSDGRKVEGAQSHARLLKKLRRKSQSLSRKKKGSANFGKSKRQLAGLHARIANIRQDSLHQLTTEIVLNFDKIVIEDLCVKGMLSNRRLSRHIMDQSFYEFRRQLTYKAKWYDAEIIVADRFYASSKLCSACGHKLASLALSERSWMCPCCHVTHDRDINAAKNLEKIANTVSSTGIEACGAEGAGSSGMLNCETMPRLKQESSAEVNH